MYVAVLRERGRARFELRRTVPLGQGLGFETLIDLGMNPGRMVSFERFGISYAPQVHEALAHLDLDLDDLDRAFAPFAPQGHKGSRECGRTWRRTGFTSEIQEAVLRVHPLDRRRMAYLRSGEVDLSRIDSVNPKLFTSLIGKCRDELEQLFVQMERALPIEESRIYVHAAFNLQRHFASLAGRNRPEALDLIQLDEAFMIELCAILGDEGFAFGLPGGAQEYMRRYVCMHYDHEFVSRSGFGRVFEDFMNDFRRHRPRPRPVAPEKVHELFGMSMAEIRSLSRREFARIFRKKAMSMHPDKGGDHDAFVELLDVYKRIVSTKGNES